MAIDAEPLQQDDPAIDTIMEEGKSKKSGGGRSGGRRVAWEPYLDAALGLKNYWYPAFFSKELAEGGVQAEEICGERIIFKRVDGKVYAVQDRCLHRGVAFSPRPECFSKNTLTCWFHGFTFDVRDGKLVQVLSQPGSALIGKVAIPSYPVREDFGLVWVFIGDEEVPFEADLPPVLQRSIRGEQRRAFFPVVRVKIACDWRLAIENGFDPGHVYGHRDAEVVQQGIAKTPLAFYPDSRVFEYVTEPGTAARMIFMHRKWLNVWRAEIDGVVVEAAEARDLPDTELAPVGRQRPRDEGVGDGGAYLPCLFEAAGFPDGHQTHLEWYVPVDENHHMYTIMATLPVDSDEEEAAFYEECETKWGDLVWSKDPNIVGFNNFDAFGRQQVAHAYYNEDFWHRERLFKPDLALTEWRLFVCREARGFVQRSDLAPRPEPEPSEIKYVH